MSCPCKFLPASQAVTHFGCIATVGRFIHIAAHATWNPWPPAVCPGSLAGSSLQGRVACLLCPVQHVPGWRSGSRSSCWYLPFQPCLTLPCCQICCCCLHAVNLQTVLLKSAMSVPYQQMHEKLASSVSAKNCTVVMSLEVICVCMLQIG